MKSNSSSKEKLLLELNCLSTLLKLTLDSSEKVFNYISSELDNQESTIDELYMFLGLSNKLLSKVKSIHCLTTELRKDIIERELKSMIK